MIRPIAEAAKDDYVAMRDVSTAMTAFLATSCGLIAAGNYLGQPLSATIGQEIGLPQSLGGVTVAVGQFGYVLGLLFLAPLGDIVENRLLLLLTLAGSAISLAASALATNGTGFLVAYFGVGISSAAVQMLVTLAVFISNPAKRGQMIGNVTGGLLAGMMLAWPVASFVSGRLGWRPLFGLDAFLILVLTIALAVTLPCSAPVRRIRYPELVRSLWGLVLTNPELRRRAFVQALLFACFSLFWTAAPLELARDYGLGSDEVALFGLVGGAGAFIAPLAGRIADRGKATAASRVGMVAIIVAYLMSASISRLWVMAGVAVVINAGVQMNHVISQRAVLSLRPDASSRLNGLYVAIFFLGGAVSSAIAVPLLLRGWPVLSLVGAGLGLAALGLWSIPARQQSVVSVVS